MGGAASSKAVNQKLNQYSNRSQATKATEEREVVSRKVASQIKSKNLSNLGCYEHFEAQLPLSVLDIREYEGRLKKLVYNKETVSMKQLQQTFAKHYEDFDLLNDRDSVLYQIVTSSTFKSDEKDEEMNIQYLLLLGLLYCQGTAKEKAYVLYDILQDGLQENISAGDKDLKECFSRLINLATISIHQWAQQLGDQSVKGVGVCSEFAMSEEHKDKWDEVIEKIQEKFLDDVFDVNSKITRKDFISQVASKQQFLFNAAQIRKIVIENYNK